MSSQNLNYSDFDYPRLVIHAEHVLRHARPHNWKSTQFDSLSFDYSQNTKRYTNLSLRDKHTLSAISRKINGLCFKRRVAYALYNPYPTKFKFKMPFWNSKAKQAQKQAQNIREDLYRRVQNFRQKYSVYFKSIDPELKTRIVASSATGLADMLDRKETTAVEVLFCFIERASTVGIQHNYILDEMFDEASKVAASCDRAREQNPDKKCWKRGMSKKDCFPPFFGVPVSIKETILMKGRQTYAGFVSKLNPIPDEDPALIEVIKNMGLIPFARTNVCQACKSVQTNNNIFGYTKNYRNPERSCGGSSGGEGGIVGAYCSPIGIGSDIGGSLRVPAEFNGLFTLKPSYRSDRRPNAYYGKYSAGSPLIGEPGALTHSIQDLITYSDFTFDGESYKSLKPTKVDPYQRFTPLNYSVFDEKPKLKIGVVEKLDTLHCSKSHQRVLKETSEMLKELGHGVKSIKLPDFQNLYFFMVRLITSSPNLQLFDEIKQGQPFIKEYRIIHLLSRIPWIIKRVIIWIIKRREPRIAKMIALSKPLTVNEFVEHVYHAQTVQAKAVHETFVNQQIDLILMPGFAVPAPKLGQMAGLQYCLSFNSGWNVIQYPVGALPVSIVKEEETTFEDPFEDTYTRNMRNAIKGSEGLPVGIQLAALPQNEEKILYMMAQLEKKIDFNRKHPLKIEM